jgi:GNAT superfamily N-acetyltransferase
VKSNKSIETAAVMEINLIKIREASVSDIPALCNLLTILFTQEADFTPDLDKQFRALKTIIENASIGRTYCADNKGKVIGMVSVLFTVSTAEGGAAAWMEDLIVHADYRCQGVGLKLVRRAVEGARSVGCTRITVLTDATNSSAIRFYEHDGFVRSSMTPLRLHI